LDVLLLVRQLKLTAILSCAKFFAKSDGNFIIILSEFPSALADGLIKSNLTSGFFEEFFESHILFLWG
jgi:hypothetical protein